MSRRALLRIMLVPLPLLVTACGGTATTPTISTDPPGTATAGASSTADVTAVVGSDDASATRMIQHAAGETAIVGTPHRIVALEWSFVEDLLALGVTPIGVADVAGYNTWVHTSIPLPEDVTDVGTRQEPSLESIAALEPDLILGVGFRHRPIYEQLSAIAPTLIPESELTDPSSSQFDVMQNELRTVAEAINRQEEAQVALARLQDTFAAARRQLEDAGLAGSSFVLVQAWTSQGTPQMRVFLSVSTAGRVLEELGLRNAWQGEFDPNGFNTVGIEALTTVDADVFLYMAQANDDPFTGVLADNPVWTALPFVTEGHVYAIGGDVWPFGGPLSMQVLVERVVAALAP